MHLEYLPNKTRRDENRTSLRSKAALIIVKPKSRCFSKLWTPQTRWISIGFLWIPTKHVYLWIVNFEIPLHGLLNPPFHPMLHHFPIVSPWFSLWPACGWRPDLQRPAVQPSRTPCSNFAGPPAGDHDHCPGSSTKRRPHLWEKNVDINKTWWFLFETNSQAHSLLGNLHEFMCWQSQTDSAMD